MKSPNKSISFMHTADWHIMDIQYGRRFRGQDIRKAIMEAVDLAIYNKVDFILNGGDTLHFNRPSSEMLSFVFEVHKKLQDAGIPMFTVTGNHDGADPSFLTFPELANPNPGLGGVICLDNDEVVINGCRIHGFPAAVSFDQMVESVRNAAVMPDIVVWHGAVEDFVPFPMPGSGLMSDLPEGPKAWLLGDIHLRGSKRTAAGALVSYPGTIEMISRGEPAEKFVDIYNLAGEWKDRPFPDPHPLQINTRPVVFLTVNDDAQADQALSRIREVTAENPGRSPLIFASFDNSQKAFVNRVLDIIDPRDTVFRAAVHRSGYKSGVAAGIQGAMPELRSVVDEVVPPGSPVNLLAHKLIQRDAKHRAEITMWVEGLLSPQ